MKLIKISALLTSVCLLGFATQAMAAGHVVGKTSSAVTTTEINGSSNTTVTAKKPVVPAKQSTVEHKMHTIKKAK